MGKNYIGGYVIDKEQTWKNAIRGRLNKRTRESIGEIMGEKLTYNQYNQFVV